MLCYRNNAICCSKFIISTDEGQELNFRNSNITSDYECEKKSVEEVLSCGIEEIDNDIIPNSNDCQKLRGKM